MPADLELTDVGVRYGGVRALDGVSLRVAPGTILGLIGPNGAGKTTLINATTGFATLATGSIRLGEQRIDGLPPHRIARAGIARTYQNIRLFGTLDVRTNLAAGAFARRGRLGDDAARALLQRAGVPDLALDATAATLPYGDQRRLEIARALAAAPAIVMLDEPRRNDSRDRARRHRRATHRARHGARARGVRSRRRAELRHRPLAGHARGDRARSGRDRSVPRHGVSGVAMSDAILQVDGLRAGYGAIDVLHEVSIALGRGTLCAIVGANGAGKTTLLLAISAILKKRAGSVTLDGDDVTTLPPHALVRRGLLHVPEGRRMLAQMSVDENLQVAAAVRGAAGFASIDGLLTRFPILRTRRNVPAGSLSGGEQQMLAIARALAAGPKVLLLDEPSMGLAPKLVDEIFGIIASERAAGTSILLVEQNARRALALADHAYVLERGRITLSGSGAELLANSAVTAAYLGV